MDWIDCQCVQMATLFVQYFPSHSNESLHKSITNITVGPRLYVKNSLNSICSNWTDSAKICIARKADCPQECDLVLSTKHPYLPPL